MKRVILAVLVLLVAFGSTLQARVTEKVEKLIGTNQERERTYYPRDKNPNLIKGHFGYPYMAGATYTYNIDPMWAVGVGAGAFFPGIAMGMHLVVYPLPNIVSPYIGLGVTYLGVAFESGTFAAHGEAGVDFALDNGLNFNIGAVYMASFAESEETFGTAWGDTKNQLNDLGIQMGVGVRF